MPVVKRVLNYSWTEYGDISTLWLFTMERQLKVTVQTTEDRDNADTEDLQGESDTHF